MRIIPVRIIWFANRSAALMQGTCMFNEQNNNKKKRTSTIAAAPQGRFFIGFVLKQEDSASCPLADLPLPGLFKL